MLALQVAVNRPCSIASRVCSKSRMDRSLSKVRTSRGQNHLSAALAWFAMTLADRIAVMKGGNIMQLGSPDEIYNRPKNLYVADFIGSPSMNFFKGQLESGVFKLDNIVLPMTGYDFASPQTTDRPVTIGIRPEHVLTGDAAAKAPVQMSAEVDLVEPMGSDTLVYMTLDSKPFRIRMDGQAVVKAGQTLAIGIDPSMASLFDNKDEARL